MSDDIVVPGEELCVIEEFLPSQFTYADELGYVRSLVLGRVVRDLKTHDIKVEPVKNRLLLRQGDIVYGKVVSIVNEKVAIVKIVALHENGTIIPLKHHCTGLLHISQASNGPSTMRDIVGIGDVVRAKIISTWGPPYLISIKAQNLGVVYALCPRCRVELRRRSDKLQCPSCGTVIKRKVPLYD